MPRRSGLNDKQVAALPRKAKRYNFADPELRGHYLRVSPDRATPISYAAVARDPSGKQHWATLGTVETLRIDQARELARQAVQRIKDGKPTSDPGKPTVTTVAQEWLERHVLKQGLRSRASLQRVIDVYITPRIGDRIFADLKRSDIAKLLDAIEDNSGSHMADRVLGTLRSIGRWVQSRDDDYIAPFTARMARTPKQQRERSRVLTDSEIAALWNVADGPFGAAVKLLLLTAQRSTKVCSMRRDDIEDGVWNIRTEAREKGNAGKLKLPQAALDILAAQPSLGAYVFPGRFGGHFKGLTNGQYKAAFDAKSGVKDWRIHDLRRTARSLMSRAGIQSDVAERVLGHVIPGVEGIYNRHGYDVEKADALTKLAHLIKQITSTRVQESLRNDHIDFFDKKSDSQKVNLALL
jgi:integrase